jgi:hypothetical protein
MDYEQKNRLLSFSEEHPHGLLVAVIILIVIIVVMYFSSKGYFGRSKSKRKSKLDEDSDENEEAIDKIIASVNNKQREATR